MKAMDIIDRLDLMEPNAFSPEQKLHWLSVLDGKIYEEVIKTHEDPIVESFTKYDTGNEELIIPAPYGEDIYYHYLMAMMDAENQETQRFNRRMTLYNSAYREFTNWYNRHRMPKSTRRQFI